MMRTANRYILAIDEAGHVGYSDRGESFPGEFGLAAGVTFPAMEAARFQSMIANAAFKPRPGAELHITDLPPDEQRRLREFVANISACEDLMLFYSAISVEGFHKEQLRRESVVARAQAARRSPIKLSGSGRVPTEHLLEVLYRNVILEAVAWCNDRFGGDYHLTVQSDQTDAGVIGVLNTAVVTMLKAAHTETTGQTGFDPATRTVVKGSVSVSWKMPASFDMKCGPEHLTVDSTPLPAEMALIPDAIANWMAYHLKRSVHADPDCDLACREALHDFPLSKRVYRFTQNVSRCMTDTLYGRSRPV